MPTEHVSEAQALVIRGIEAVEGSKAGLVAVEKSVDQMRDVVAHASATADRAADALDRIAKAEEDRTSVLKAQVEERGAIFAQVWKSQPTQLLLILAVLGLAQVLGLRWLVEAYLPHPSVAPVEQAP